MSDVILSWLYSDKPHQLPHFGLKETFQDVRFLETTEVGDVWVVFNDGRRMWCSRDLLGKAEMIGTGDEET